MINADSNNSQLMLKRAINYHLKCSLCRETGTREIQSLFSSTALVLKDRMVEILPEKVNQMSFVEEGEEKRIRMAHLAVAGSHSVNGVSSLHTKLLKKDLFSNFHTLWPERFVNVTNGITQRRWLLQSNRLLAKLINDTIGDRWIKDLYHLKELEKYADDKSFQKTFMDIKRANKERLANLVRNGGSVTLNPDSLFDVHAKRIHEYKRQSLKIMHIIYEYLKIVRGEKKPLISKTFIFSGWAQEAILNVARMGKFSSDRSISEYADHIWHIKPLPDNIKRLKKKGTSKKYV